MGSATALRVVPGLYYGHTSLGVLIAAWVCTAVILLAASLYRRKKMQGNSGTWKQGPSHKWRRRVAWTVGIIVLLYLGLVALGYWAKHTSAGDNGPENVELVERSAQGRMHAYRRHRELPRSARRFRVVIVVPFAEEDESPFVGLLQVEAA